MEKESNSLVNLKACFSALTPEEQYHFIVPALLSSNGYTKWRIKTFLNYLETPDLLTLLPPEVQLLIFSSVDGTSLLKACQVSRTWNELIQTFDNLWRSKSLILGVNIGEKPSSISWQKAFAMSRRQLHLMEAGMAFKEKYINLQNSRKAVKAVDYDDGYLCTVSEDDCINVWQLELNIPVMGFRVSQSVSCIKFCRHSTLVCGHFTGILTSWDLSDMSDTCFQPSVVSDLFELDDQMVEMSLLKAKYKMHSGPVFSCDFSEKLNLLVSGSADEKIKFWCLSTGALLHSVSSQSHWVLRVLLIPCDSVFSNHSLLTMTRDSVDKYQWPAKSQSCEDQSDLLTTSLEYIKVTASVKLNKCADNFITPGLQISSSCIGLVKQDLQEKQAVFELLDIETFNLRAALPLNFKVRKFLALGDRFAMFLTTGKVLYSSTLIIIDITNGKTVGTHTIPHSKMTTPDGAQLVVGDTGWLNGLKGWEFGVAPILTTAYNGKDGLEQWKTQDIWNYGSPLVLAAGIWSQEGKVFTLWWGRGEEIKTKTD